MALGMVQTGYRSSLYQCPVGWKTEGTSDYTRLLAELTTELELEFKDSGEASTSEEEECNSGQKEYRQVRKKGWEEVLKQSVVLDVMLRQMIENGLGQQKKEQQENPKKWKTEELDNEVHWDGSSALEAGHREENTELSQWRGNSEFLSETTGNGREYFSPSAGGRKQKPGISILCLTCETECERKRQWKITD